MLREEFFQFIWKHRLYSNRSLRTTCGIELEVIRPGEQNFHSGPDFFNALIKLDNLIWAGNVEIHQYSSAWFKHGHHLDPAYDNVILHVVQTSDQKTKNSKGRLIHTVELDYPSSLTSRIEVLRSNENWLPCHLYIRDIPGNVMMQWFNHLQAERIGHKSNRISKILWQQGQNLEETLYIALASGFGLPINSLPFEMLAAGIPMSLLLDRRDSLMDLEAILFGHSGLLHRPVNKGSYAKSLMDRYEEIKKVLPGKSIPHHLWKFLRLRPASFPTLRISQFALLIHQSFPMANDLFNVGSIRELEQTLRLKASEYWNTHYMFGKCSPPAIKQMGHQTMQTLIINVIVPYLCAMGKLDQRNIGIKCARDILSGLEAESNHIIKNWKEFGIRPRNAFESQALIQLHNVYCKQKRCLDCQIGTKLMGEVLHGEQSCKKHPTN